MESPTPSFPTPARLLPWLACLVPPGLDVTYRLPVSSARGGESPDLSGSFMLLSMAEGYKKTSDVSVLGGSLPVCRDIDYVFSIQVLFNSVISDSLGVSPVSGNHHDKMF